MTPFLTNVQRWWKEIPEKTYYWQNFIFVVEKKSWMIPSKLVWLTESPKIISNVNKKEGHVWQAMNMSLLGNNCDAFNFRQASVWIHFENWEIKKIIDPGETIRRGWQARGGWCNYQYLLINTQDLLPNFSFSKYFLHLRIENRPIQEWKCKMFNKMYLKK